ncbi:uncharacterized protein LOC127239163 [Andrographis paniculata]|uniref:uncharacterized protein LOC127239163 n=1 Tax=Andrographis paniculata TaxID=175694 RepID=UPI0021E8B5D5|nr:uncharacterized protein LOC127239163 [Andrographis paniculata]
MFRKPSKLLQKEKRKQKKCKGVLLIFFYENGIPFNASKSRSYEIMVEAIGQYGSGLKPTSYHQLREPFLEDAVNVTHKLKERHMEAWKQYGCSLMSDGWIDKRGRHLINFLINSPEGTFFLESIDVSAESHDARMLADLLEKKVEEIGKEYVVQIVTDNGANYKAAGRLLEQRILGFFWTPCAAHCIDLMLEDIGKMNEFKPYIQKARDVTTFIYRHGRILSAMREKTGGRDLVRPVTTQFATTFLTLQSFNKYRNELRRLFVSDDWSDNKLSKTSKGKKVMKTILSSKFWDQVEDCLRATLPLLIVLRIVDGDEKPAMPELSSAMNHAKEKITESFTSNNKTRLLAKLTEIIEDRWSNQMEVKLYGAALFLNPSKYFELKRSDPVFARKQRQLFNDVVEKMVKDEEFMDKISDQADDYDKMRGSFGRQLNWVDDSRDLVHEDGDLEWHHVDEAVGASSNLNNSNLRSKGVGESSGPPIVYDRRHGPSNRRLTNEDEENDEDDMNTED